MYRLGLDHFSAHLHETFVVHLPSGRDLILELIEANILERPTLPGVNHQAFTLVFRGDSSVRCLPQRTYELEHRDLGVLPVFLAAVGKRRQSILYEAVFA